MIPSISRVRIISAQPGPWSVPPEVMAVARPYVDTDASGWDVMRETLWVPYSPYFAAGERRDQVLLPDLPTAIMVVQTERVVEMKAGMPIIELTSYGIARAKPWKCVTNQSSYGEVAANGLTRNYPSVTCYWFSTALEGTKLYIPWPAVPPEIFGWTPKAISSGSTPNQGWAIQERSVDPLPVIAGSAAQPWKDVLTGGNLRPDANTAPRPRLCAVTDHYLFGPLNTMPPND